MPSASGFLDQLLRAVLSALRTSQRSQPAPQRRDPGRQRDGRQRTSQPTPSQRGDAYPGDYVGVPEMVYAPHDDAKPDPGEVVWTWVPFEEDHTQGKDRPVLLVGRDGKWLLALPLTSKDHDRDAEQERRAGRLWTDIGTGDWDRSGRPSEVRVNRVLRVDPATVRRGGGHLDRATFDAVAQAVRDAAR